jgi:hypothetical protein
VALGKKWHKECFRCEICDRPAGASFIENKGRAVCKQCHVQHVADKCDTCRKGLAGGTWQLGVDVVPCPTCPSSLGDTTHLVR